MVPASPLVLAALSRGPIVCTLRQMLNEYDLSTDEVLTSLSKLTEILSTVGLRLDPPIGLMGLDDDRVLKRKSISNISELEGIVRELIEGGEGNSVEFKSSIRINRKKQEYNPELSVDECVDEQLSEKVAREIAAFLNADGGKILFGVTDEGIILGCDDDFASFRRGGNAGDKADLIIHDIISKYFIESDSVFFHTQIECVPINKKNIVLVSVAKRKRLSFLKVIEPSPLFIRVNSHAKPIPFNQIENYFELTPL
jgi:hypothetical protein